MCIDVLIQDALLSQVSGDQSPDARDLLTSMGGLAGINTCAQALH